MPNSIALAMALSNLSLDVRQGQYLVGEDIVIFLSPVKRTQAHKIDSSDQIFTSFIDKRFLCLHSKILIDEFLMNFQFIESDEMKWTIHRLLLMNEWKRSDKKDISILKKLIFAKVPWLSLQRRLFYSTRGSLIFGNPSYNRAL